MIIVRQAIPQRRGKIVENSPAYLLDGKLSSAVLNPRSF
jgi:hypothetical protein